MGAGVTALTVTHAESEKDRNPTGRLRLDSDRLDAVRWPEAVRGKIARGRGRRGLGREGLHQQYEEKRREHQGSCESAE